MTDSPVCELPTTPVVGLDELTLRVVGTEHDGRILRIKSAKCTIGSAQGCTLRLRAPGVRGVHCLVLRGAGGLAVRNWSPDTRLNGRTFTDALLTNGDRLTVGPLEFEILTSVAPAKVAPVAVVDDAAAAALEREREELQRRLLEREQLVERLSAQLAETERLVEQARSEAVVVTAPAVDDGLAEEVVALRQQVAEFLAERTRWLGEQAELLEHQQQREQTAAATQQQADAWEKERIELTTELRKAHHANAGSVDRQRELREAEVAVTHWRERFEESTREVSELQRLLAEVKSIQLEPAADQAHLRSELEAAARQLDNETEKLLQRESEFDARVQAWEAEQARLAPELVAKQDRLATVTAELETRRTALEEQTGELEARAASLAEAEEDLQARLDEFTNRAAAPRPAEQPEMDQPVEQEAAPFEPASASDIIARLSASGLWKDDVPAEEPSAAPKQPEPAWKALVEEPAPKAPPAPLAEEEDSIEAYMQRLLQRVSGDSDQPSRYVPPPSTTPSDQPAAAPEEVEEPVAVVAETPFDPTTYVPRSTAPELSANLAAMRKLANTSARSAIDSSSKRRQAKHASGKIYLSLGAVATAVALWWLSLRTHSAVSYYAALTAGAAAFIWGLHAGFLWVRAFFRRSAQDQGEENKADA
jgi:hypothetical protein